MTTENSTFDAGVAAGIAKVALSPELLSRAASRAGFIGQGAGRASGALAGLDPSQAIGPRLSSRISRFAKGLGPDSTAAQASRALSQAQARGSRMESVFQGAASPRPTTIGRARTWRRAMGRVNEEDMFPNATPIMRGSLEQTQVSRSRPRLQIAA